MRRIMSLVCVCVLLVALAPACFAENYDFSDWTFDELVDLREQINLALMSRPEYQSVEVPQGVYEVGKDIPAGEWTIRALDRSWTNIETGHALTRGGSGVAYPHDVDEIVYSPLNSTYSPGKRTELTVTLEDGDFVGISFGAAVFSTYTGTPSLGFR